MSAETETTEIIRRRLFDWDGVLDGRRARRPSPPTPSGSVDHRQQLPSWFPVDHAREAFEATYPFHP